MKKIFTIAQREYRAMVATKAFLISLIMMPVLMLGSLAAMQILRNSGGIEERKIMVIDKEGLIYPALNSAAEARNRQQAENAGTENGNGDSVMQMASGEKLVLSRATVREGEEDQLRVDLSNQVRNGELYGFVEIRDVDVKVPQSGEVLFYSQDSGISGVRDWFYGAINEFLKQQRLSAAGIDAGIVARASAPVPVRAMGLVSVDSRGNVIPAQEDRDLLKIFLPFGAMLFMFMVIFMSSQPTLESVLEEKSLRIAEVLLGSASPFQLMMGKLIGTVGGSLTVFVIYLAGGMLVAHKMSFLNMMPISLLPWFLVFQILGVLFYAAIFMAIGASVSQLKEAQAMLMPVWMVMMLPMFVWLLILQSPNGPLARGMSFFPPSTPTTMVMRLATGTTVPLWELVAGVVLLAISAIAVVFFAGRVFRAGILWQGKTPHLSEILRWAWSG